jgi:hypothetical protein
MRPPLPAALVHRGARRFKQADVALLPQHALGGGPKTLGNAAPVDVVVPPVVGGPEQGRPVNGFVPVDRPETPGAGETGASWPAATVFPLITGFTVFPLSSGLLVFCASDTVVVKVRTRTLRPTSSRRFAVMVDLPFGRRFPPPWSIDSKR